MKQTTIVVIGSLRVKLLSKTANSVDPDLGLHCLHMQFCQTLCVRNFRTFTVPIVSGTIIPLSISTCIFWWWCHNFALWEIGHMIYRIQPNYRTVCLGFSKVLGKLVVKYVPPILKVHLKQTRGPRATGRSPEWHSYGRYADVMQHFSNPVIATNEKIII